MRKIDFVDFAGYMPVVSQYLILYGLSVILFAALVAYEGVRYEKYPIS